MDFSKIYNILASAAIWSAVLLLLKPDRILRLAPVGLWGLAWMLTVESVSRALGYYQFIDGLFMIAGIPLFHYVFGLGAAILIAHFLGAQNDFNSKLLVVFIFVLLDQVAFYGAVTVGILYKSPDFLPLNKIFRDFVTLSFYAFTAEGWFGHRLREQAVKGL